MQRSTGEASAHLAGRGQRCGRTMRLKPSLLDGASSATLARMASAALALGVALPSAAQAQTTVNPTGSSTYTLTPANNPIIFGSGTNLTGGVLGPNTAQWNITNEGSIAASAGAQTNGLFLIGGLGSPEATVTNSGSISGVFTGVSADLLALTNAGSITGGSGPAVHSDGGSLVNNLGGVISATSGAGVETSYSTVDNSGEISSTSGVGARLETGVTLTNNASGVIEGTTGVLSTSGPAPTTIANSGAITGTADAGVSLTAGDTLTNNAGGVITGTTHGVYADNTGAATVTNAGQITSSGENGVLLAGGGSVTNQTGGSIGGAKYGVRIAGATGSVTNAGSITGGFLAGVGLASGGSVTNQTGGSISGRKYGVSVSGGAGIITNAGSITGRYDGGVYLGAGGALANQSGGSISGGTNGVNAGGASVTVTNAGTIKAGGGFGVIIDGSDGTVTNQTGGVISGGTISGAGVFIVGGSGMVTNAGQITGVSGVLLFNGGSVINQTGGSITGSTYGVHGAGTVTNAGAITGTSMDGVYLAAGGTVANYASGVISGGRRGVYVYGGSGTVTNAGQITGASSGSGSGFGVLLASGGSVTNQTGGSIYGAKYGVKIAGGSGTVTNAGAITGGFSGVYLGSGGAVTNQAGGAISGVLGVAAVGGAGDVTNAGAITGTLLGVGLLSGGTVTNQAGGVISGYLGVLIQNASGAVTNAGSITGSDYVGVYLGAGGSVANQAGGAITGATYGVLIQSASGSVTNAGAITGQGGAGVLLAGGGSVANQAGGAITGSTYGVLIAGGAGSVTNAGVITGATASVEFQGSGPNVLTLQTGSVLSGPAVGSTAAGATNALVLQGTGEADNAFVNFQTLKVQATGTWTLGGTSSIGSTEVASGTLVVNGALTSTTTTVDGPLVTIILGAHTGTVSGGGTLEIGDQAHASAKLTGAVTVNAGGVLAGHGTIVGDVTNNGVVSPGGTIGVLTINGDYAQNAGGVLSIEASPGQSSQLQVNGTATLAGSLQLAAGPGIYRKGLTFDVLNATAISGVVSSATASNGMPIAAEVQGQELLAVVTQGVAPLATGATANQHAVANAFANVPVGTSDFDPVANSILGMSAGLQQNGAFDKLGGEVYADLLVAGRDSARAFLGELSDQMSADASRGAGPGETAVWGRAFGGFGSVVGDANTHGYSNNAGGAIFGVEHHLAGDTVLGASASYGRTDISLRGLAQTGDLDTGAIALYGEHRAGLLFVDGALSYDYDHGQGARTIALPGVVARKASSGFSGGVLGGLVEAGLQFERAGFVWRPSLGVLYSQVNQDGFTESGAGGADLAVASKSLNAAESLAGVRVSKILYANGGTWRFDGRLAWTHERGGVTPTIDESFAAASGTNFALAGARLNADGGLLGAGLIYDHSADLSFYARYQGVVGDRETQNAVTLGARFAW